MFKRIVLLAIMLLSTNAMAFETVCNMSKGLLTGPETAASPTYEVVSQVGLSTNESLEFEDYTFLVHLSDDGGKNIAVSFQINKTNPGSESSAGLWTEAVVPKRIALLDRNNSGTILSSSTLILKESNSSAMAKTVGIVCRRK